MLRAAVGSSPASSSTNPSQLLSSSSASVSASSSPSASLWGVAVQVALVALRRLRPFLPLIGLTLYGGFAYWLYRHMTWSLLGKGSRTRPITFLRYQLVAKGSTAATTAAQGNNSSPRNIEVVSEVRRITVDKYEDQLLQSGLRGPTNADKSASALPLHGFGAVGGQGRAKQQLCDAIVYPFRATALAAAAAAATSSKTAATSTSTTTASSATPSPYKNVCRGVLLYGPPGTGKTMLAKALADELQGQFLEVRLQDLYSKYVGESEKLAAAVFSLARKVAPCVIFIDEIDALLSTRGDGSSSSGGGGGGDGSQVFANMKSVFLAEWDGLGSTAAAAASTAANNRNSSNSSSASSSPPLPPPLVVVVGATNRRRAIDSAFQRRLPVQIEVPLPDLSGRRAVLRRHLDAVDGILPGATTTAILTVADNENENEDEREVDGTPAAASSSLTPLEHRARLVRVVAACTEGYSGSELKDVCIAADQIRNRARYAHWNTSTTNNAATSNFDDEDEEKETEPLSSSPRMQTYAMNDQWGGGEDVEVESSDHHDVLTLLHLAEGLRTIHTVGGNASAAAAAVEQKSSHITRNMKKQCASAPSSLGNCRDSVVNSGDVLD